MFARLLSAIGHLLTLQGRRKLMQPIELDRVELPDIAPSPDGTSITAEERKELERTAAANEARLQMLRARARIIRRG